MSDFAKLSKEKEFDRFSQSIGSEEDLTMLVLRAHLFSENLFERLIASKLPRGDKILESGNFSYHQKLVMVDAFDCVPDPIISALRGLNKLRNQCAHELDKTISEGDITKIGSPLGKNFSAFKKDANLDYKTVLRLLITHICGYLAAHCYMAEHPDFVSDGN